jgi:aquaporin-4
MASSMEDLKSPMFWRAVLGECVGTLILVLIGCGTCVGGENEWEKSVPTTVQISLAFGLAVATVVWCLAHVR